MGSTPPELACLELGVSLVFHRPGAFHLLYFREPLTEYTCCCYRNNVSVNVYTWDSLKVERKEEFPGQEVQGPQLSLGNCTALEYLQPSLLRQHL